MLELGEVKSSEISDNNEHSHPETPIKCSSNNNEENLNIIEENPLPEDVAAPNPEANNFPNNSITYNVKDLLEKITFQDKIIQQINDIQEKCSNLESIKKQLEIKLDEALKAQHSAIKEKENMVIRYAVGEKSVIKERQQKEQIEKKYVNLQKESDLLQHKLQTMISEKNRICQILDNKTHECKNVQAELDKAKQDLNNSETKLKWTQNSLKIEIEAHRECQAKTENLNTIVQDSANQIELAKRTAEETIKNFMNSQENRAHILDQQVKEQHASLILLRHERCEKDQQVKLLQTDLERLQTKHKEIIEENNKLSVKVQQLERERLENGQKLSELRGMQDQQRQDVVNLQAKNAQFEQLKLQLKHEQEQLEASNEQVELFKQRNQELESDMEGCREKEADLLLFTQQLTDKNVRLQSEFTALETKVQQLSCEQTFLKRQLKEQEHKVKVLNSSLKEEQTKYCTDIESLKNSLEETKNKLDIALGEIEDSHGENILMKRKFDLNLKEINKELHNCMKKLEQYESSDSSTNTSNSNSSLNVNTQTQRFSETEPVKAPTIDTQTLIEHIVKLQRISAKKSEKIDFLEEHVNNLVGEIQRKTKLLQSYVLREQSGTLTSNTMDKNKAQLAKLNGIMASVYSQKVCDENLTLELSLDINRKLQAVLEDALLKNITLKENVDTLGCEIEKLNQLLRKA